MGDFELSTGTGRNTIMTNSTRSRIRNKAKSTEVKNNEATNEEKRNDEAESGNDKKQENEAGEDEAPVKNDEAEASSQEKPSHHEAEDQLFSLVGPNIPCLPLEVLKRHPSSPILPASSSGTSPHWVLAPFQNLARTDGLKLKHWARSDDLQAYRFAKFNTTSNLFSYSTEEYYHFLRDDDWTKEETDYLFDLLNTYDLRFPIVHDRYEFVGSRERSLDDLKARYYAICQKLIQHRPSTSAEESSKKQALIQSYNFDKQREIERKKHVQSLLNRSKSQLMEEEFIYVETRRIEQTLLKRVRNQNDLMKLIGGHHHEMLNELKFWPVIEQPTSSQPQPQSRQLNHNNTAGPGTGNASINPNPLKKNQNNHRKSEALEDDVSISAGGDDVAGANIVNPEAQLEHDRKNCIYRFDSSNHLSGSITTSSAGGHYRSVGLRSTRITLPKTVAASTRISTVMNELKIPSLLNYLPKPLMMPTRENVESYERLIQAINQLVEVKRIVDRVESDLKNQRKKLDSFLNSNHHHHHSNSHHLGPGRPDAEVPSAIGDHTAAQEDTKKLESNSVQSEQAANKFDSLSTNTFKLHLNKKRSVSVTSSCSKNSVGDPSISPEDQATTNHNNKNRNHSNNSRKKMRKN